MVRRQRRWIAGLLTAGLVFAQIVTAAHACPILTPLPESPKQVSQADTQAMPSGCPEMAKSAGSTLNVCESHCFTGQQVDAQADAPTAMMAPQPALTIRVADSCVPTSAAASSLSALGSAPPPLLRFSRFLI